MRFGEGIRNSGLQGGLLLACPFDLAANVFKTIRTVSNIPAHWLAPDIALLYAGAYAMPHIRSFATRQADDIAIQLPNVSETMTRVALILAGVALLTKGNPPPSSGKPQPSSDNILEWLAWTTLFTVAQMLLTRQVRPWRSYFASATSDSSWWCLTWSIWLVYEEFQPNNAWSAILAIAPFGVLLISFQSLTLMYRAQATFLVQTTVQMLQWKICPKHGPYIQKSCPKC
jgi:hypothetical protein